MTYQRWDFCEIVQLPCTTTILLQIIERGVIMDLQKDQFVCAKCLTFSPVLHAKHFSKSVWLRCYIKHPFSNNCAIHSRTIVPNPNFSALHFKLSFKMFKCLSTTLSIKAKFPKPAALIQPQTITEPPPWFTVCVFLGPRPYSLYATSYLVHPTQTC